MKKYDCKILQCEKDIYSEFLESTFEINKDIDFIYNMYFKNFLQDLKQGAYDSFSSLKKSFLPMKKKFDKNNIYHQENDIVFGAISTKSLTSADSKKANSINPLTIYCGIFLTGNFYQPSQARSSVHFPFIQISVNVYAIETFFDEYIKKSLGTKAKKYYSNVLSPNYSQSTIAHELSHWIDDSLHKGFLTSLVDLSSWLKKSEILLLDQKDVNATYFEINAQIHAIKNLKRLKAKDWDNYTMEDLFWGYSSLMRISEIIYNKYGKDVLEIWEKYLMKRMARENLLGKNMKGFIDTNNLESKKFRI